jgi:hypothetical protein
MYSNPFSIKSVASLIDVARARFLVDVVLLVPEAFKLLEGLVLYREIYVSESLQQKTKVDRAYCSN